MLENINGVRIKFLLVHLITSTVVYSGYVRLILDVYVLFRALRSYTVYVNLHSC